MSIKRKIVFAPTLVATVLLLWVCSKPAEAPAWKPLADWGHWILGHRSNLDFLQKNNMTVTFGSGAPNFEYVTRAKFDSLMDAAKAFNDSYHVKGYIVLRYLSTSLNGDSETRTSEPQKSQIHLLKFYNEQWQNFEDYLGPKPADDPTTWMMVHPDGSFPYYRYAPYGQETDEGFETWGCPDNPDYLRYMEGKIRAQAETGIDGSYVDWTHIAGGTCYCNYTRQNFIQYLKDNLPPKVGQAKYGNSDYDAIELPQRRGDKFWMEWISYRGHAVARFHDHLRTVAKKYNPNFMVSGNVFGGFGYGPIAYDAAGNMEMLGKVDDFIYSEMQEYLDSAPRKREDDVKITNSPALKFLAAASHGKPTIIYATEITPPIFPNPTEKCLSAMAQINIAEAEANHAIFREKRETPPGATEMYAFLAKNRENMISARLYSNVAVLASLNQYLADELSFAFSASRVLADMGIHHVMIVEDDLFSGALNRFDLIYIPYMPLLSMEKQEALKKFAENGGKLLISGQSGFKNEFNLPHQEIVLAGMFDGGEYPIEITEKETGKGVVTFMPLIIPSSKFLIPVEAKGDVTTFGPSMADVFPDIPERYTRNLMDPQLRKHLEEAADKLAEMLSGNVTRLNANPPYMEMTAMLNKEKNVLLAHLVNYNVTVDGDITPAQDAEVQVILPAGKTAKSVKFSGTLLEMKPLEFASKNDGAREKITFTADEVKVYGLAVVELE
jgi:hypothetical protein